MRWDHGIQTSLTPFRRAFIERFVRVILDLLALWPLVQSQLENRRHYVVPWCLCFCGLFTLAANVRRFLSFFNRVELCAFDRELDLADNNAS